MKLIAKTVSVKIEQPEYGEGYYLTIGDSIVYHTWAVTKQELKELQVMLNGMEL